MDRDTVRKANAAAEAILATPSTNAEWTKRPGELIPAAYTLARAWHEERNEKHRLTDEFADKGTLKHFLLSQGYLPNDEADARAMLIGIFAENDRLRQS